MFDPRVIKIVEQRLQIGMVGLISFVWFELGYAGEIAGIVWKVEQMETPEQQVVVQIAR